MNDFYAPPSMLRHCDKVLAGEYECGVEFVGQPRVLDVGANVGAFTVWAMGRWPNACVCAYEPNPEAYVLLCANTRDYGMRVVRYQNAVRAEAGTAFLHHGANNLGEASLHRGPEQVDDGVIVDCVAARDLPDCDVLKIDTEGCEVEILCGYLRDGHRPTAILLEFHREDDRIEIDRLLRRDARDSGRAEYSLVRGTIHSADRGVLCYLRRP